MKILPANKAKNKSGENLEVISATLNKLKIKAQKELEEKHRKDAEKFLEKLEHQIDKEIKSAIKVGKFNIQIILDENWNYFKFDTHCFEFHDVVTKIVEELRAAKYEVYYGRDSIYHDTTLDYMNSGGECGSSTPRYTNILALNISW
jgi:hypothetical protein